MVLANTWSVRNAHPFHFIRHPDPDFSTKKESSLSFTGSILQKPISRNGGSSQVSCRCTSNSDGDWNRWSQHFSEVDRAERLTSVLKLQLEDAVEEEDFQEAVRLKNAIAEAASKDTVAEVMSQLKNAIDEERYTDASILSRCTGTGLVGWWIGLSKDSDDPFGRVVRITPGLGRFVARIYSPRQLMSGSPGTPLFEIFLVKDADASYVMKVVYMQPAKATSVQNPSSPSKSIDDTSKSGNSSTEDNPDHEDENQSDSVADKNVSSKEATEEVLKGVIDFLKDRIPGLKVKVMNVSKPEEVKGDNESQLIQEEDDKEIHSSENREDEISNVDGEGVTLEGGTSIKEGEKDNVKLFIGGILNNKDKSFSKTYLRVPAELKSMERDSFVLHIPKRDENPVVGESKISGLKLAAIAAEGVSELMPSDVAKAFWSVDKVPSKVSRDVREAVKLALSQAQRRNRLSTETIFNRINNAHDSLDPFDGLYVGAFGPYGTEVVQLRRKVGDWHDFGNVDNGSSMEFFEYVEAIKLTGDLNVPAGEVTFRAKIGKENRLPNRGLYPEELGVIASYKGQGRIAEAGFRNPQWVDGELLQLNGKGLGQHVRGAELGFLYVVPEQSFLVLFDRLKLPG
ncbi:protein EXECUTER 2, chloroplastic [Aristolochia californica]|uniref:protein EXECUTER 2, chloroplastic n=1 Tax=Aristolochia californica TaxID=171875 RepID=UPI0035DCE0EF